jgi:hypothetical protein
MAAPGGCSEVPAGALDGELVLELAEFAVAVDPVLAVLSAEPLELGAVDPEVAANATEVPTPTSSPVKPSEAMSCLVLRFMVGYLFLRVRWGLRNAATRTCPTAMRPSRGD